MGKDARHDHFISFLNTLPPALASELIKKLSKKRRAGSRKKAGAIHRKYRFV